MLGLKIVDLRNVARLKNGGLKEYGLVEIGCVSDSL
jgi:hypothetical protein